MNNAAGDLCFEFDRPVEASSLRRILISFHSDSRTHSLQNRFEVLSTTSEQLDSFLGYPPPSSAETSGRPVTEDEEGMLRLHVLYLEVRGTYNRLRNHVKNPLTRPVNRLRLVIVDISRVGTQL